MLTAPTSTSGDPETPIDYDFAQQELMMKQFGDDPIQEAITAIEKQHEEEKLGQTHNMTQDMAYLTYKIYNSNE